MGRVFDEQQEEPDETFDAGFQVPDTKRLLDDLSVAALESLQKEHQDEEEKLGNNKKRKQKSGGSICCCQREGCGIGPFIERN